MKKWQIKRAREKARLQSANRAFGGQENRIKEMYRSCKNGLNQNVPTSNGIDQNGTLIKGSALAIMELTDADE